MSQARVRGLIKDIDSVQTSINTFKTKYGFLPGDFPNAGQIWPSATCPNSAAPAGCNGNGNWQIAWGAPYLSGGECYRVMQHLSLAGIVQGNYTGLNAASSFYKSSYGNALIGFRYKQPHMSASLNNRMEIGAWYDVSSRNFSSAGAMTPFDTYSIDLKIDDGLANSGKLYGWDGDLVATGACSYTTLTASGIPNYNLNGTQGAYCRIQKDIE